MRTATYLVLATTVVFAVVALTWASPGTRTGAARMQDAASPESVFGGPDSVWWSQPAEADGLRLYVDRLALPPGERIGYDGSVSGAVIYVESGMVTFVVHSGVVYLSRDGTSRGATGTPSATSPDDPPRWPSPLPVEDEITLNPGDTVFHDDGAQYSFANHGEDEALVWRSELDMPRAGGCGGPRC